MNDTPIYERGVSQAFREYLRQRIERDVADEVIRRMFTGYDTGDTPASHPDSHPSVSR